MRQLVAGSENQFEKYLSYYAASFIATEYSHRDEHTYLSYAAPGRQISRYALRGDRTAFLFVFRREQPFKKHPGRKDAKKILWKIFGCDRWTEVAEIFEHLEHCNDLYFDGISQIQMLPWSRGRSVLVGDAAYAPSLLAGEGAGLAMAGVHIPGGELKRANGDHTVAFSSYERRLRNLIQRKQLSARRNTGSFSPKLEPDCCSKCCSPSRFKSDREQLDNATLLTHQFELPDYTSGQSKKRARSQACRCKPQLAVR